MKLHELKPNKGAVKKKKRLGRGEASGKGGTSTKGHKGQQSRSGYSIKWGHEGGQIPIQRRLPKRGFKNINTVRYKIFNIGQIAKLIETYGLKEFSAEVLYLNHLIGVKDKVKILAYGEVRDLNFKISVHAMSKQAKTLLEKAGCTIELLNQPSSPD